MVNTNLTGEMFIGTRRVRGTFGAQKAFNPRANQEIAQPIFGLGDLDNVNQAADLAAQAFDEYRNLALEQRAKFLEDIAQNILDLGDALIERAMAETGLPQARIIGERGRTANQLRLFAQIVKEGSFLKATIDPALPKREPLPRQDLRLQKIALGPVAVFGASNFPLAFSVAGGDTAAALAAGCPVIVKAHSAHLGTAELIAGAITKAVLDNNLPLGVFSLLMGAGRSVGSALVAHPNICAVGFTGSRQGGLEILKIANNRPVPIPVYAEMSSINPVFLSPQVLKEKSAQLAQGFVDSLTLGAGQFCTNPGLVIAIDDENLASFVQEASSYIQTKDPQTMLTAGIYQTYCQSTAQIAATSGVSLVAQGKETNPAANAAGAALYITDGATFLANKNLHNEAFGPASLIVKVKNLAELLQVAESLEGQLTATLHFVADDANYVRQLLPVLERKAGRILANGWPTGVEVCYAMVHGGAFPSTSNAMHTSVGAYAIERFLRPVCYQDLPDELLPLALQEDNPLNLVRTIEGKITLV